MTFDRAVCVSLRRRPDRLDAFLSRVPHDWPFASIKILPAIDGKLCKPPAWWRQGGGAWGCYRSHLKIIEDALNDDLQSVLIFEDDATFCDNFSAKAVKFISSLPADWEQAYLGGQHLTRPVPHSDGVVAPRNVNRTHAYALNGRAAMTKVYRWLNAADQWLSRNHIDHHYGRLHKNGGIKVFAPTEWLCGQAADTSDISWKHVPERWWQPGSRPDGVFVAVIGLHRSGSSCVAMMLHKLGVNMGDRIGGYESKNGGGGEAAGLAAICESAARFPRASVKSPSSAALKVSGWVSRRMKKHKISGGKYPHLCAFGEALRATCGSRLRIIHCDRPLEDSIESLKRRSRLCRGWLAATDEQCEAVQRWLWDCKNKFLATQEHHTVRHEDLLENPAAVVDGIIEYLGLSPTDEQRDAAISHVLVKA